MSINLIRSIKNYEKPKAQSYWKFTRYYHTSRIDHRRRDLDNQATAILDALVLSRVIPDDSSQIVQKLIVEYMGVCKEQPRAEIQIEEIIK